MNDNTLNRSMLTDIQQAVRKTADDGAIPPAPRVGGEKGSYKRGGRMDGKNRE